MKSNSVIYMVIVATTLLSCFFCAQGPLVNLNFFVLLIYLGGVSFLGYRSVNKANIFHISWMAACLGASIYFPGYISKILWIGALPLSLLVYLNSAKKMGLFRWVNIITLVLFALSGVLFYIGDFASSAVLGISALIIRQGQVPFHLWMKESSQAPELFPSFLFLLLCQSGFALYAQTYLSVYNGGVFNQIIPGLTLFTGLYLAISALLEKRSLPKHLLLISSQSCLPLAAFQSYSGVSATGGILFAMTLALGGIVFGFIAYHIWLQKGIVTLNKYHSLYRTNKSLAAIYLVSGLSLVGLPFTLGYIAEDILFHGLVNTSPWLAGIYVLMTALNAYTVFLTFNCLFLGHSHKKWASLKFNLTNRSAMPFLLGSLVISGFSAGPLSRVIEKRVKESRIAAAALFSHKGLIGEGEKNAPKNQVTLVDEK